MRRHVPLARPDYSLDSVAAVLLEDGSPAVVVVDAMLRAIGVVTRSDVLRFWDAQRYGEPRPPSREHAARLALAGMRITHLVGATALDVMSPIVETLPANTTIVEGAATLTRLGSNRSWSSAPTRWSRVC